MFGDPTIIVIANPDVNDVNAAALPAPGVVREGIEVETDTGLVAVSDDFGIAVLSPVESGPRTLALTNGVDGTVSTTMGPRELREIAVAVDSGAETMTIVDYDFGGTVLELTPETTPAALEDALAMSDTIILLRAGTYVIGDIEMAGSRVTLFAEGILDRTVVIQGNLTVKGSSNRVRGALIDGDLNIEGSDAGVAFTTVLGTTTVSASSTRLLFNDFCGPTDVSGSNVTALGNAGMAPIAPVCP